MREADFLDAEALLIRLSHLARPNREAALILERVKLYLADQFDRVDHPYVLPAEFAAGLFEGSFVCTLSGLEFSLLFRKVHSLNIKSVVVLPQCDEA